MKKSKKISYKFSKIPQKQVEQPVPMDLSSEITKMFEVNRMRKQRISEYMCESIRKTKLKAIRTSEEPIHHMKPSRPTTSKDLRKFSEKCPIMEMSRFQEKDIRNRIQAEELEKKHSQFVSDMFKEAKQHFVKIVHYAGMNMKIKSCHQEAIFTIQPYKFVGKTNRYQEYLQIRKLFQNKWILHYPIVRNIHKECVSKLPYELFNLEFKKTKNLQELEYAFKDKTQRASQFIYEFYQRISALVEREDEKIKIRSSSKNYLASCTGILSLHLSKIIAHTIMEVVNHTASDKIKPHLSLEVFFDGGLVLKPEADVVFETYSKFLDAIIETGAEIYVLERKRIKGYENKYIRLCLTQDFIDECKRKIRKNICTHYEPILGYLEALDNKFDLIYTDINSESFYESISDIKFEEGCNKISYYREYLHKVLFIPDHEFFGIGKMSLTNYREVLHDGLTKNIHNIFDKLCAQHFWEANDLCETFRMIQIRANQKPLTTEELIETGRYMTWIKNEHLSELNVRVHDSLLSLCQIIDLGILSEEHMELNSSAIKWLDEIVPIIEEHSSIFESLKFDAEEKLQKVVEEVTDMIKNIYPLLVVLDEMDDIGRAKSYLNSITLHMTKIKEIEVQILWINKEEVSLSFPKSTYSEYEDLKNHIFPFYHLLKLCSEVQRNVSVWQDGPFDMLDYETTSSTVAKFHKELTDLYKTFRKKLRQAQDDNVSLRFKGTVDDPDILNWPAPLKLCGTALKLIEDFQPSVKVMKIICNPTLSERHWLAMSEIAGQNVTPNAGTTLRKIMMIDFQSKLSEYEIISTGATKEKHLKDDLDQLKAQWNDIKFLVTIEKEVDIRILTHLERINSIIDDHNIKVLIMRGSVFVKPHDIEVRQFFTKIHKIKSTIENWTELQNQLLKLTPIFRCEDLKIVLPKETELFQKIVNVFDGYISLISEDPVVIKIVEFTNITQKIEECLTEVEIVDRRVVQYLEVLRQSFPRFYFLADEELSHVISKKELAMNSAQFFNKLFPGIHKLYMNDGALLGVCNSESETLEFQNGIEVKKEYPIEKLCSQIEQQMKSSLKTQMVHCYRAFNRTQLQNLLSMYSSQIIEVISQIYWTGNVEYAMDLKYNIKLRMYQQKMKESLRNKIVLSSSNCLTHLERIKLKNLVVHDISNKNLMKKILESNRINKNHFEWESYFRYYYKDEIVHMHAMNSKLMYEYEYQESSMSIISTPLTDRCIRVLLNAYHLNLNGIITNLNGTSISETIRGLIRSFGGMHISNHGTKNSSATTLKRLIFGSVLCGSWLFLENLHLIEIRVLSVISQELSSISAAKKHFSSECIIGGKLVHLNTTSFICAGMEKSIISNTFLPSNFKELFRIVAILEPDYERIAEATLLSYGFQSASSLSKKLCYVFNLLRDLMPNKSHYNFGIHKLKKVLLECVRNRTYNGHENELDIIVGSIKKCFDSEIENTDGNIYNDILSAVFPDTIPMSIENTEVKEVLLTLCEQKHIQPKECFISKVLEAYEHIHNKSSIIIVGQTYTGKTTAIKLCSGIFENFNETSLSCHFINPNSLDYESLYGYFNPSSHIWMDGIIQHLLMKLGEYDTNREWLVFDGTIDSSWIENIKSLLDERRKFYCDSGKVFMLRENTSIIFEVENLDTCSPSIVSCSSIIFFHESTIGWKAFVESWVNCWKSEWIQEHRNQIFDLFCWIVPPCLEFIGRSTQLCNPNQLNSVRTMTLLTQIILDDVFDSLARKEDDMKNFSTWIQATIIQAGVLGLGAILDTTSKHTFDEFYKLLWKGQIAEYPYPKSLDKLEVSIPHEGLICDYQYIYKQRGNWKLLQDILKTEKVMESPYMHEFLIPTVDTLRCHSLLDMFVRHNQNILFIGPSGTGKSILIEDALMNKFNDDIYETSQMNFDVNLNSRILQKYILSKLNKRNTGYFTPSSGKKLLFFIDNLNLVSMNESGNSTCLELLRQYLDHNFWYDFTHSNDILIDNINLISAMGIFEGSRKKISQRLYRHFNIFAINDLSEDAITKIYTGSLLHTWRKIGFPSDISTVVSHIVQATFSIYKQAKLFLRATLSRCHYIFNLNSFSKVIQGCAMLRKEIYDSNKKIYLKLWAHEIMRVFGDRLSSLDNSWLQKEIRRSFKIDFNESFEENFEENGTPLSMVIFSTMCDRENSKNKIYEEITDQKRVTDKLIEALNIYNNTNKIKLEMIFFQYSVEKILKLSRILSLSPGNALLLGSCGSGRRSLSKLSCFFYKYKLFEPIITQGYSYQDWNAEIKLALREAGALEHQCVLLVTEEQLIEDRFLHNIDNLLHNAEFPDLYDMEERQEILELARLSAQGGNRNLEIASSSVFHYFNKRSRENLHLIVCLSPVGKLLRERIRNYPNLMSCHVIWWDDWPDESLQDIARTWMANNYLEPKLKDRLIEIFIYCHRNSQNKAKQISHESRLTTYVTPVSFTHLLKLFVELITKKQNEMIAKKKLYLQGLAKLSYAAKQISDMQKALAEYQPQLAEMTRKAIEMTEQIALETIEVEKASALVRKDEEISSEQSLVAQILKSECESELAQAIPILEDAISALNTLKPSDITLVKSMKNPPDAIKLVMAAVCVIKDIKPDRIPDPSTGRKTIDYWGPSKRILGDMNFLQTLKDFDKDHIKPEIMVKIRKEYLPHKDFKPHVVAKASSAAEGLCKWIIAMDMYDKVAKEVAPKKEKLEKAEKEYAETVAILNQKKDEVKRIEEKLASLKDLLNEATKKQLKLQQDVDVCNKKLGSAQNLIGSLGGEKIRWTKAVENLEIQEELLPGNMLLSSTIIAYMPPFNDTLRYDIIPQWHQHICSYVSCSEDFSVIKALSNEADTEAWVRNGLPNDEFFFQNGVIYDYSKLYSLFIDPQNIAEKWICKLEKRNNLIVTKFTHDDYLEKLKSCIVTGKPIMIHKIKNKFPACLSHFISKQQYVENEKTFVILNNEHIEVDFSFKIYFVSNVNVPQFPAEQCKYITLINFTNTHKGLSQCLLKIVTEIEKPELKKKRKDLFMKNNKNRMDLAVHENNILKTLCESETDILEDETSIRILDESKDLARIVREKQEESKSIELVITKFSHKYESIACFAADLYSCITSLPELNYVYQFSLEWFLNLYHKSILLSEKSRDSVKRAENIKKAFIYHLYRSTAHSLFKEDKHIFLILLTLKVMMFNKAVTQDEINFLFDSHFPNKDASRGADEDILKKLGDLEHIENFQPVLSNFDSDLWKAFSEAPCLENIPSPWNIKLTNFQKLLLMKVLDPNHLFHHMQFLIRKELGEKFVESIYYNINDTFNCSYSLSPILFFLTPEFNPSRALSSLADKKKVSHSFKTLSFGDNEIMTVYRLIDEAQSKGSWLLLENYHLAIDWFELLERRLTEMNFDNTHENFRLWLTSEIFDDISLELLQNSTKVIADSSNDFKQTLMRLYKNPPISEPVYFGGCPGKHKIFTRLLYSFASFHSAIQYRMEFKEFGWSTLYFFDDSDFQVSLQQLQIVVNEDVFSINDLTKISYLLGHCHYGGYFNEQRTIGLIDILLQQFVNTEVSQNQNHSFSNFVGYGLPKKCDYQDYINLICQLPEKHEPEMLGLNRYADTFVNQRRTEQLLHTVLSTTAPNHEASIEENEFSLISFIENLMKTFPLKLEHKLIDNHFISIEFIRFNNLLKVISESLQHLKQAIGGTKSISSDEEDMAKDILRSRVPKVWYDSAYINDNNLPNFVKILKKKIEYFQNFKTTDKSFPLHVFSSPKALISKAKLDFSARLCLELKDVDFHFEVLKNDADMSDNEFAATDLFIFGAKWDEENEILTESQSSVYNALPPIVFRPVYKLKNEENTYFECPLYQTADLKNFVTVISLKTEKCKEHWMKRGVRIICQI